MMAAYWDVLVGARVRQFPQLLEDVTLNAGDGRLPEHPGQPEGKRANGRQPDENYAREVMQLLTIGLYQLEPRRHEKTDADGAPIDTYGQSDMTNLARVFTG